MKNTLITVIIIIILVLGGFFLFKNKGIAPTDVEVDSSMPVPGSAVEETQVVKEFSVDAAPFSFSPATMTVNKGDKVEITVKNINGTHNFKIDEFNVTTRMLKTGETQTISFVADKTGTFEYYCSVGNHRAMGMVGNLIVR